MFAFRKFYGVCRMRRAPIRIVNDNVRSGCWGSNGAGGCLFNAARQWGTIILSYRYSSTVGGLFALVLEAEDVVSNEKKIIIIIIIIILLYSARKQNFVSFFVQ